MLALACGSVLLPLSTWAADAVTVNPDGTTTFNYTVAGPNLLGSAAPQSINGTGTGVSAGNLDATAAGKLFTVSGTSNGYPINLPSATIGDGVIIGFSVAPWASANQEYALTPASGQTIDGSPSLKLIYTNYVELMSVGGNWVTRTRNAQPTISARYALKTAQSIGATWTVVNFDTASYDTNSSVSTGSAWHFTCPVAGLYSVYGQIGRTSASTTTIWVGVWVNGTQVDVFQNNGGGMPMANCPISDTLQLKKGDQISIKAEFSASVPLSADGLNNFVTITRISP